MSLSVGDPGGKLVVNDLNANSQLKRAGRQLGRGEGVAWDMPELKSRRCNTATGGFFNTGSLLRVLFVSQCVYWIQTGRFPGRIISKHYPNQYREDH